VVRPWLILGLLFSDIAIGVAGAAVRDAALGFTLSGLWLSLAGTVLAGAALYGTFRRHGGGRRLLSWWPPLLQWIRTHMPWRKDAIEHPRTLHDSIAATDSATVDLRKGFPENQPVDAQIRWLREQLTRLEHKMDNNRQQADQRAEALNTELRRIDQESQDTAQQLQERLGDVATGSVRQELFGLALVGLGAVLAAVPDVFGLSQPLV
jgi:hypothetical protein